MAAHDPVRKLLSCCTTLRSAVFQIFGAVFVTQSSIVQLDPVQRAAACNASRQKNSNAADGEHMMAWRPLKHGTNEAIGLT